MISPLRHALLTVFGLVLLLAKAAQWVGGLWHG